MEEHDFLLLSLEACRYLPPLWGWETWFCFICSNREGLLFNTSFALQCQLLFERHGEQFKAFPSLWKSSTIAVVEPFYNILGLKSSLGHFYQCYKGFGQDFLGNLLIIYLSCFLGSEAVLDWTVGTKNRSVHHPEMPYATCQLSPPMPLFCYQAMHPEYRDPCPIHYAYILALPKLHQISLS